MYYHQQNILGVKNISSSFSCPHVNLLVRPFFSVNHRFSFEQFATLAISPYPALFALSFSHLSIQHLNYIVFYCTTGYSHYAPKPIHRLFRSQHLYAKDPCLAADVNRIILWLTKPLYNWTSRDQTGHTSFHWHLSQISRQKAKLEASYQKMRSLLTSQIVLDLNLSTFTERAMSVLRFEKNQIHQA